VRHYVIGSLLAIFGLGIAWVVAGRSITILIDRIAASRVETRTPASLSYDGSFFNIGDQVMSNTAPDYKPMHGDNRFASAPGDEIQFTIDRSYLSWPTPFDFNFMTGHSPSWKRHLYYQLHWKNRSGRRLEAVWRFEQWFYPGLGWSSGFMTHEGTTGVVRFDFMQESSK
jgi:hypothetical protein